MIEAVCLLLTRDFEGWREEFSHRARVFQHRESNTTVVQYANKAVEVNMFQVSYFDRRRVEAAIEERMQRKIMDHLTDQSIAYLEDGDR